jgi:hypothetical protein
MTFKIYFKKNVIIYRIIDKVPQIEPIRSIFLSKQEV